MKEEIVNDNEAIFPLYGFNLCKQKYDCFNTLKGILISDNDNDALKIGIYTYYLEFLNELYEFYIANAKRQNIKIKDVADKDDFITEAVNRLIYFFQFNDIKPISTDFAKQFRRIRNLKAHMSSKTVSEAPLLAEFYCKYHEYIMLLMKPPLFSWNHPVELWDDINLFCNALKDSCITNNKKYGNKS